MTTRLLDQNGQLVLVIPPEAAASAGLAAGAEVTIEARAGQLVAESTATEDKPKRYGYTLEELVAGITPENCHEEWDVGPPVGKERFWEDE
jgi:antitoxin MazE